MLFIVLVKDNTDDSLLILFVYDTTIMSRWRTPQQAIEVALRGFRDAKEWFTSKQPSAQWNQNTDPIPMEGSESAVKLLDRV